MRAHIARLVQSKNLPYTGALVAALLVLPALLPTLAGGLAPTADGQVHLHRTVSVALNLRAGLVWPRWGPHLHLGYGYPIHNFYAPGVHIFGALMVNAGLAPATALVLTQALGLVLYSVGAYNFARTFLPARAALLGAAVYAYAPFRFREMWVQGNLSQFVAMGLLPWVLWALTRAAREPSAGRAAWVGATFGALVLAHHPTAFVFSPLAVAYALVIVLKLDSRAPNIAHRAASTLGGLALGVALAAVYWVPALAELGYVNIGSIERGMFNISLHFVEIGELLAPSPPLDRAALNPPMPHNLGTAQVVLALLGLAALHPRSELSQRARLHILLGMSGLAVCVTMMLPASAPVWEALPLGSLIAFPWRLVGVAEVCLLPAAGAALMLLPARWRDAGLGVGLALTLLLAAVYIYPLQPFLRFDRVTPATAIEFELQSGALGTVSADEYRPRWVEEPPLQAPPDLEAYAAMRWWVAVDEDALPDGISVRYDDDEIILGPGEDFRLRLRQFYFPGWRAEVDNAPVAVKLSGPEGLIALDVPASERARRVEVWYGGTGLQAAAGLVSLGVLGICVVLWAWSAPRRSGAPTPGRGANLSARTATILAAAILAVTAINQLLIAPHTDWFRPRSDPSAPAMMQHPVHARLRNGDDVIELLGYDLEGSQAAQGDTVGVRLYWRALHVPEADYRPFVHWDSLPGTETWANSTLTMPGSAPTSRWDPDLYVVDMHRLAIPADTPPVVGNLVAGLFDAGTGARLRTEDGADVVLLTRFRVVGDWDVDLDAVPNRVGYRLGDAIRLVGWEAQRDGEAVHVCLYWQAAAPVTTDYTVFLHVLDRGGERVAQGDRPPLGGLHPTTDWLAGQVIPDDATISLEADAEGPLTLAVGLYDPTTMTRLEVRAADGARLPNDAILIPVAEP